MQSATSASRPWVRWFPVVGLCLFMLVPVYVASVGPACWLRQQGWISFDAIETAYAPLTALKGPAPRVYWAIDGYAAWWVRLAESK